MKSIFEFIFYKLMGWKILNDFPRDIDQYLLIAAPHTSNWDFPIAIMVKMIKGSDIKFIGKHTLFKPPFGFFFRAVGGMPVNRETSSNTVQAIIDIYKSNKRFAFALSPEGTRKKVSKWKTGFYHIAVGAEVPIVLATLDFGNKQVLFNKPYYPTGEIKEDFLYFHEFFKEVKGKNPENFDPDFHMNV